MQKAADARAGSSGGGTAGGKLAKFTSWLSSKSSRPAATLATDAPIVLSAWNPLTATVDADEELRRISDAFSSCGSSLVPPTSSGGENTLPETEIPTSAADAPVSDADVASVYLPDTVILTAGSSQLASSGKAQAPFSVVPASNAVAVGEDDEDDDEDEEDDE